MFLSMNWISDFVDLSGLDKVQLINRFSLSTAEVENEIFYKGKDLSGIVVAEIKSIENHPESKKLHLLKVDAGEAELTDVVCGAPNVRVGMKTAFAKVGAKIGEIEEQMLRFGALGACMSGSGPTVFGLFKDRSSADLAGEKMKGYFPDCRIISAEPINNDE